MQVYQSGLVLSSPSGATESTGRTFTKWLYQILKASGWTLIDSSGTAWTSYQGSGTAGKTVLDQAARFDTTDDASYTFTSSDVGRYITITGFTGLYENRNGTYRILDVLSDYVIILDIQRGVHDAGVPNNPIVTSLSWEVWAADTTDCPATDDWFVVEGTGTERAAPYSFHLHVRVTDQTNDAGYTGWLSCFPSFRISPYADWNAVSHDWDSEKVTSERAIGTGATITNCQRVDQVLVFACVDTDNFAVAIREIDSDEPTTWNYLNIGEFEPIFAEALDPCPVMVLAGTQGRFRQDGGVLGCALGYGIDSGSSFYKGIRQLKWPEETSTIWGYLHVTDFYPSIATEGYETNNFGGAHRFKDPVTDRIPHPKIPFGDIANYGGGEYRGFLKKMRWSSYTHQDIVYGTNSEFFAIGTGIVLDWHGATIHNPRYDYRG